MRIEEGKDKSFALSAVCREGVSGLIALRSYVASFFPSEDVMVFVMALEQLFRTKESYALVPR